MLAKAALDVPALVVEEARKVLAKGTSVGRLRPAPPSVPSIQGNDAALDAKFIAAEAMVVLGVVAGIGQYRAQIQERGGLAHGGCEVRRVLTWPDAGDCTNNQMRMDVENRSELGPSPLPMAYPLSLAAAFAEMLANVARLQPGRIHCRGR